MIPLEQQVCSLEQAKKLKELGVKQESYFAYSWAGSDQQKKDSRKRQEYLTTFHNAASMMSPERTAWGWGIIACAFTCAELGVMLPDEIEKEFEFPEEWSNYRNGKYVCKLDMWKWDKTNPRWKDNPYIEKSGFGITYRFNNNVNIGIPQENSIKADTESEARAALLIHLLEQKIISVDEVNKKL